MTIQEILDLTWVSLLFFAISLGVGVNLLITKNPKILKGKADQVIYRDPEQFAVKGGYLMLLLAFGSLVNTGLLFLDVNLALMEALAFIAIFIVLWKKMSDKYGPIRS